MAREYSGSDCQIFMFGRQANVTKVSYKGSQSKEDMYVLGKRNPHAEVVGRKKFEGSLTLPQSEFEAIVRSLPAGNDVLDIAPFNIVIMYIDEVSKLAVTDVLEQCSFTEYEKAMENEDGFMEVALPLRISNVVLNKRSQ